MATDRELAAQSMMQAGIGSLGGREIPHHEYNKFQVRANEPEARALENYVFDWRREGGNYPMNIDSVPHGKGWKVQDRFLKPIEPMRHLNPNKWLPDKYKERQSAGIPATNQGYRVQQAGGPLGLYEKFLQPYMPWYDKEQDEKRYKPYIDPEIEQDRLDDEAEDKAEWLSEYGPSETGEFYPDKIIRDLYPQYFGGLDSEDLGMEQLPLEASAQGLPGTEVAQSKWKEKFQSIIDMIRSRENLDERGARKFVFDNYGLAV
jgi:hypothetical protein